VHNPCSEIGESFSGTYDGVAVALSNGNTYFAIPLKGGGRCMVGVDGEFALYEEIAAAWDAAEYGDDTLRAVRVKFSGEIEQHENRLRIPVSNPTFPWLHVSEVESISNEVTAAQADETFELVFGMSLVEWLKVVEGPDSDKRSN
jgi:hypothetical protein